jgi:hypothetical protein
MPERNDIRSLPRVFAGIALAGVCVIPLLGAEEAEGGTNLVSARIQVVTQSRNSRVALEYETGGYYPYEDYYPSVRYGTCSHAPVIIYQCPHRRYAPRIAAPRHRVERRVPVYRSHRGGACPQRYFKAPVSRRMEVRTRESGNYRGRRR